MMPPADTRTFPIHPSDRDKLASVPWSFVAPHERQAQINHSQTLTRLAERGGLSLPELLAVVTDRDYFRVPTRELADAENLVRALLAKAKPSTNLGALQHAMGYLAMAATHLQCAGYIELQRKADALLDDVRAAIAEAQ